MPLAERLQSGLGFTSLYVITHLLFLGLGLAGVIRTARPQKILVRWRWWCCRSLYQIWTGGDPVRIWRMMTPAQPAAALLFGLRRV